MEKMPDSEPVKEGHCWCGTTCRDPFGSEFFLCHKCGTLVGNQMPTKDISRISDEENDLYGKQYWLRRQQSHGLPTIEARMHRDLPERCLSWLETLLHYHLPSGRLLEVGCGPGAFVALSRWAGWDAQGLELSPWVSDLVRRTFQVPVLCGPLEDQALEPESLDVIVMCDVLEHLADPVSVLRACSRALKPDGILLIQTPCLPPNLSFEDLHRIKHPFVRMMHSVTHLFLYSQASVTQLLQNHGFVYTEFQPAFFSEHDLCVVASRQALKSYSKEEAKAALLHSPSARLVRALLEVAERAREEVRRKEAHANPQVAELPVSPFKRLIKKLGLH